jgi:molecular chaperone GrpE
VSASDPDDLLDALTRLTADFRNYRARVERDRDRQRREDLAALLAGALEVLDVADAAAVGGQPADVAVAERLHAWLASLGLERIRAHRGTVFDPTVHEAVAYVLDPAGEPGELVVTAELRSGWTHDGILLRPAAVEVGPWT